MAKKFEIGNITLPNRYILAPMAGYTNEPLRKMAIEGGAGLVYTEMISATALAYNNQKTFDMLPRDDSESPLALQLFGGNKDIILNAIDFVEKEAKYDFLDFNMGCPVPKVMKQEAGSYWLKRQDEVYDLLHSMVQKSHKPVIIKIRLGFDKKHINAVEIAKIAEQAGIKALAVHGRTRDEYYNGFPHYEKIAKVKNSVSIPVIANGNIDLNIYNGKTSGYIDEGVSDKVPISEIYVEGPYEFISPENEFGVLKNQAEEIEDNYFAYEQNVDMSILNNRIDMLTDRIDAEKNYLDKRANEK